MLIPANQIRVWTMERARKKTKRILALAMAITLDTLVKVSQVEKYVL